MNFDMIEAAKLGAATHQQSVQNPSAGVAKRSIHHEISDSQATPSNYSNQGKSHYTATQSYTQNESGYL